MAGGFGAYEYSRRITIGGGNGTYVVMSPWNTPCEFALAGISASGAGGLCLTDQDFPGAGVTVSASTQTSEPASDGGTNSYPGTLVWFAAAQVVVPDTLFTPMAGNRLVMVLSGLTSASILVTLVFRRPSVISSSMPALREVNPDQVDEALYQQVAAATGRQDAQLIRQTEAETRQTRSNGHGR